MLLSSTSFTVQLTTGKIKFPALGGSLEGRCLWEGVEEVKKALDLRFHDWATPGSEAVVKGVRSLSLSLW
jgi:hypothetical protein